MIKNKYEGWEYRTDEQGMSKVEVSILENLRLMNRNLKLVLSIATSTALSCPQKGEQE
jgi:hypothetical protein